MNTRPASSAPSGLRSRRGRRRAAFTLVQLMVATAVFLVGSGLCLSMLRLSFTLAAKNVSLNDSNAALQTSFTSVLGTMESSILVDCANYDPTAKTFTTVADGTWGNTVRFMRIMPVTTYILPDDGSGYTMDNPPASTRLTYLKSGTRTINVTYNASLYPVTGLPASARFYPTFPATSESLTTGASPGTKPGLGIASVSNASISGTLGKATLNLTNAIGDRIVSDCTRGYVLVECALSVIPESTGGPKRLLYFDDASLPASYTAVCSSLDGTDQSPPDASPTGTTYPGCFRHPVGTSVLQAVLPIRSRDYSSSITLSMNGGAQAEMNSWVRLTPQFRQRGTL